MKAERKAQTGSASCLGTLLEWVDNQQSQPPQLYDKVSSSNSHSFRFAVEVPNSWNRECFVWKLIGRKVSISAIQCFGFSQNTMEQTGVKMYHLSATPGSIFTFSWFGILQTRNTLTHLPACVVIWMYSFDESKTLHRLVSVFHF